MMKTKLKMKKTIFHLTQRKTLLLSRSKRYTSLAQNKIVSSAKRTQVGKPEKKVSYLENSTCFDVLCALILKVVFFNSTDSRIKYIFNRN